MEVSGGTAHLVGDPAWWDPAWSYRRVVTVTEMSNANLVDAPVMLTLDAASLVASGKLQPTADDLRFVADGQELVHQVDLDTLGTARLKVVVSLDLPALSTTTVHLYYGNPTAAAPLSGGALSVVETADDVTVERNGEVHVRMDKTTGRNVIWGRCMGSIIGLRDGTTDFLATAGCIRYASLQWLGGPSEGEIQVLQGVTTTSGPLFAKVTFRGDSINGDFSHVVHYRVFNGTFIDVETEITANNANPSGFDGNRAPIPGVLEMDDELPNGGNGEANNEGWATLRKSGGLVGILLPRNPNAPYNVWGKDFQFDWMQQNGYGGFGGWKMRPVTGTFTPLSGTAKFKYGVLWSATVTDDAYAQQVWRTYSQPPVATVGEEETRLPTDGRSLHNLQPVPFSALLGFQETAVNENGARITYQLSVDGGTWLWWDAQAGSWQPVVDGTEGSGADEVNQHISTLTAAAPPGALQFRATLASDGVTPVTLDEVSVSYLP
ncbi:MAG: hypothetical protein AB2A00_19175 [Myxococcota bacterium]